MARIKINDLAKDVMISQDEMKKVFGGLISTFSTQIQAPTLSTYQSINLGTLSPGTLVTGCGCMGMGQDCNTSAPGDVVRWMDQGRPVE